MKKLILIMLLAIFTVHWSEASQTAHKIPVTMVSSPTPQLGDSDITDQIGVSLAIGVPVTLTTMTGTYCLQEVNGVITQSSTPGPCGTGGGGSGSVTSITFSAPLTGGTITSTGTVGIPQATSGNDGYLYHTDWNTFNTKQTNLNLVQGTYINGDLCAYSSSGGVLNCNVSGGTVTSVGLTSPNSTMTIGNSPITSSGNLTADINWPNVNSSGQIETGGVNWASINSVAKINSLAVNWANINGLNPINSGGVNWINISNYATGNVLQATTAGGVNWGISGAGSVLSVSGIAPILSSGGSTPAISVNWTSLNLLGKINMGGINWYDAQSLNQGVNWYQVPLISNTVQTTQAGVGLIQLWNAAKTFFFNQSVNSSLSASYGINWPALAPIAGQVPEVMDAFGDINWVSLSSVGGGASNWSQLGGIGQNGPAGINWVNIPNSLRADLGINWASVSGYTSQVNWGGPAVFAGAGQSYVRFFDTAGINWVELEGPVSLTGGNVNWTLPANLGSANQFLMNNGNGNLNWSYIPAAGVNWTNIQAVAQSSAGVNWQSIDPSTGQVNWQYLANGATTADIMCWKSNGQPGHCTTSITGVLCASCS